MLTVVEALELVLNSVRPHAPRSVPLAEALGCPLAEEVSSDVDSPPHDKSIVDGYALRFADLTEGRAALRILEEVTAGRLPTQTVVPGTATRIMTGAPLPDGADAVIMVEKTSQPAADRVVVDDPKAKAGQNIVRRAASMRRGEVVLGPDDGTLNPIQLGLLAEVGRATVRVIAKPQIAILATGDELVDAADMPGPGRIRNSNGPLLAAMTRRFYGVPRDLGIARDTRESLQEKIALGLDADMLLLSGGVSAGVLDLVPGVLAEFGVRQVFHKVNMKPGKPLWFGTYAAPNGDVKPVFGLPGNPVSTLVCFRLFVEPAIRELTGWRGNAPAWHTYTAVLGGPVTHRGERPTFWPGSVTWQAEPITLDSEKPTHWRVQPLPWKGSGDLRTLAQANCLINLPAGDYSREAGTAVEIQDLCQ